jgi:hypothetical protein
MVVALPTEPIVKLFISLFAAIAKPAYSIRTYDNEPELSFGILPP